VIELTLGQIAEIVGGRLAGGAEPSTVVTGRIEFDSRLVEPGGLFLAIAGERSDGHDFTATAIAAGAVAVIVTRPVDAPSIEVGDALTALGDLARAVLAELPDLTIVGVTGSSGKTSTKDLLAALLNELGATVAAPGSFNNELGHPYTVLRADRATRFLVLEYSARGIGHISYLTSIAAPRIAAVLNVGSAHLGEFGSRAAIATAKAELIEALPAAADGGVAVLNADDPVVAAMATRTKARVARFGGTSPVSPVSAAWASDIVLDGLGRPRFLLHAGDESVEVVMRQSGEHHVGNALAAAVVALVCGLTLDRVATVLSSAEAVSHWRMQVTERSDGVVIINDAYNANPESLRAALTTLATVGRARPEARTWAVLGPMAELGPAGVGEHERAGRLVAQLGISRLLAVGEQARPILDGAVLEGWSAGEAEWVVDADAAVELLTDRLTAGDVVLVKASRSAGLERLAMVLTGEALTSGEAQT
jgi:UDP-N-acetylmuramoyl-tripeptide--D-alanyl-D-alanine ligase